MHRVVDGKPREWKQVASLRELVRVAAQEIAQNAIDAFCLTVRLRMIRG